MYYTQGIFNDARRIRHVETQREKLLQSFFRAGFIELKNIPENGCAGRVALIYSVDNALARIFLYYKRIHSLYVR